VNLTRIDWAIMFVYFVFVLGIGFLLRRKVKTSTDFFLAGRAIMITFGRRENQRSTR
jgi:SSS family solute:Na+ symporter